MNDFNDKIVKSAIASGLAEFATIPICTLKTNYQTFKSNSILTTAKDMYKVNGYCAFYRASYPAIFSQIVSGSSKYSFYHLFKRLRGTKDNDLLNNSVNGALGGICGGLLAHPIDVYKIYRQRACNDFFVDLKKNGPSMLYRGYSQSIYKNIILYSALFPINDYFKTLNLGPIMSPFLTVLTISIALQPVDYFKVRKMAGLKLLDSNSFSLTTLKECYKGYTLNFLRAAPHFVITMYTIDQLNKLFHL
jgi:hypothetical protein